MKIIKIGNDEYCFPCRILSQTFKNLNIPVEEIKVDDCPELVKQYNITKIPVTLFFDDKDNLLIQIVGLIEPVKLQQLIDNYAKITDK